VPEFIAARTPVSAACAPPAATMIPGVLHRALCEDLRTGFTMTLLAVDEGHGPHPCRRPEKRIATRRTWRMRVGW
jgi:hypothetical protein